MSSDISLCTSTDCPHVKTCKRATQAPNRYNQSYFNPFLYGQDCKFYIPNASQDAKLSTWRSMEGDDTA